MTSDRWQRIEVIYHAALSLRAEDRPVYLAEACRGDEPMRAELDALLAQPVTAAGFLQTAAGAIAASPWTALQNDPLLGAHVGAYTILERVGVGGMGAVYRARDARLGRDVAIKVLHDSEMTDARAIQRFEQEARAASSLNHPNIVTIHEIGDVEGGRFIAMEFVEGQPLSDMMGSAFPTARLAAIGRQVAQALSVAHAAGIVHRDVKPANIMVRADGYVKLLDFGVARLLPDALESRSSKTGALTDPGLAVGTPRYMSPEQARGDPATASADIFALGVILYELATGRHPFEASTLFGVLDAITTRAPAGLTTVVPDIPASLDTLIVRMLEKQASARPTADEVERELAALAAAESSDVPPTAIGGTRIVRRFLAAHAMTAMGFLAVSVLAMSAATLYGRSRVAAARVRWAEQEAVPAITRLVNENRRLAALKLYEQARSYEPGSPALSRLGEAVVAPAVSFHTTPDGARIFIADYPAAGNNEEGAFQLIGETPFRTERIPMWGYYRIRAVKEGFAAEERTLFPLAELNVDLALHKPREVPEAMTWVPAHAPTAPAPPVQLPGFWIDRFEVSNRQFKAFIDAGGYGKQEYWKHPFIKDGRTLSFTEAMNEFRDATRRPGPAGWQLGAYPEGQGEMPVGGVSWYEAEAYAEYVGKSLPTVYEWFAAAALGGPSDILPLSNFSGRGPAAVGSRFGMSRFGSYDMAGNVKEWAANDRAGSRYVLGGAWDEAEYVFRRFEARSPIYRERTVGFRLVRRTTPPPEASLAPVIFGPSDLPRDPPVDDRSYRIFAGFHSYDRTEIDSRVERVIESTSWRRETVSFRAAYGNERVIAHLFLPRDATPPYQIVAFFGHSGILGIRNIDALQLPYQFVVRSGRALMIPAYSGTLERGPSERYLPPVQMRDRGLKWSMDLGRSIDYLETRSDIDMSRLAFYGVSMGAAEGARLVAVEPRFKTAVLASGGLDDADPPEISAWNFAPRVRIPVLMLNGRDDFIFPFETHQRPLFEALGTPASDKAFKQYDGGHANLLTRPDLIGEILDWLDKYLGPVTPRQQATR